MTSCRSRIVFVLASALGGCALTSKGEALDVRYFTPEHAAPRLTSATVGTSASSVPELRLGRVTSGLHLRERIAYRTAAHEIGYYEDRRWTERPDVFVRRELERVLFEERGFHRVLGGAAPTLDVEVVAFDEIRGPSRAARVTLRILLFDDRTVLVEDTVSVDVPIAGKEPGIEAVVGGMAVALDRATEMVATRLAGPLGR